MSDSGGHLSFYKMPRSSFCAGCAETLAALNSIQRAINQPAMTQDKPGQVKPVFLNKIMDIRHFKPRVFLAKIAEICLKSGAMSYGGTTICKALNVEQIFTRNRQNQQSRMR